MDPYLYWILTAIALVIVELVTGTFYLLVLAIAAAGGGALAYARFPFGAQAGLATLIAVLGVILVSRYRVKVSKATDINAIDVGHRVTLDSWVNEAEGLARVRYRDTLWDAKVLGERGSGTTFYIRGVDGSTLQIAPERG